MIKQFEYIKLFWKFIDTETPVVICYEIDLKNERYATKMIEIFSDRTVSSVMDENFAFITEAPIPTVEEINLHSVLGEDEFYAELIPEAIFYQIWHSEKYSGEIAFPEK